MPSAPAKAWTLTGLALREPRKAAESCPTIDKLLRRLPTSTLTPLPLWSEFFSAGLLECILPTVQLPPGTSTAVRLLPLLFSSRGSASIDSATAAASQVSSAR